MVVDKYSRQRPWPDEAHEDIARYVDATTVGVDDLATAMQALAMLANTFFAALDSSLADRAKLRADLDATILRVAAAEAKNTAQDASLAAEISRAAQAEAALSTRVTAVENKPAVRNVAVAYPVSLGLLSIGTRDITLQWDRALPDTTYEPEWWPSPGLLGAVALKTKTKTTTSVVVTVSNTTLIAAGGSLGAIAVRTA